MIDDALRGFTELMDSGGFLYLGVTLVVVALLVVLVHELGHAVVALACTESLVLVRVGRSPGAVGGRVGRLQFSFDVRPGAHDDGEAVVVADLTRGERLAYSLAGPAANVALALLLLPTFVAVSGPWRFAVGVAIAFSAFVAVQNLVSRDPGSDGQTALAAFRDRDGWRTDGLADDVGRWMALYGRSRDPRFSDQRVRLFAHVLPELGVDPQSDADDARVLWNAARAGCCWREIRPVSELRLAGPAALASKRHALEGRTGLELAAAAATTVARDTPTLDVDRAYALIRELDGASGDARFLFAFRYGAALHDVERVLAARGERYW